MGQKPLGKFYKCLWCKRPAWKKPSKKHRRTFCRRSCYFKWKSRNPICVPWRDRVKISGYYYIYKPGHPYAIKRGRYVAEHRLTLEKKLRRYLMPTEIAHHENGNKLDNRPENITLFTVSEHNRQHALSRWRKKNGRF